MYLTLYVETPLHNHKIFVFCFHMSVETADCGQLSLAHNAPGCPCVDLGVVSQRAGSCECLSDVLICDWFFVTLLQCSHGNGCWLAERYGLPSDPKNWCCPRTCTCEHSRVYRKLLGSGSTLRMCCSWVFMCLLKLARVEQSLLQTVQKVLPSCTALWSAKLVRLENCLAQTGQVRLAYTAGPQAPPASKKSRNSRFKSNVDMSGVYYPLLDFYIITDSGCVIFICRLRLLLVDSTLPQRLQVVLPSCTAWWLDRLLGLSNLLSHWAHWKSPCFS